MSIIRKSIYVWKTYGFRALLGKLFSKAIFWLANPKKSSIKLSNTKGETLQNSANMVITESNEVNRAKDPLPEPLTTDPWHYYSREAMTLAALCNFSENDLSANANVMKNNQGFLHIRNLMWFLPYIDYPFYGGLYTIFRFASYLSKKHNVQQTFTVFGDGDIENTRLSVIEAFPELSNQNFLQIQTVEQIKSLPPSDACVSTLWITAYHALKYNQTRRKFYLLQDFEPLFYPAGSTYAQAEETYRFGFYGLANTITLKNIYEKEYDGIAEYFTPAVDKHVFFPNPQKSFVKSRYRIFFYGRPGHPRNGFELGVLALKHLKERYGDRVTIVTAGSEWSPAQFGLDGIITNLGRLSHAQTGDLYRECDLGLIMMFTRHPSYLPFELMACNCTVISNFNRYTSWFLRNNENCFLANASVNSLSEVIERAIESPTLREIVNSNALELIKQNHLVWDSGIEKIYSFMQSANQ